jgi:hypothetical protein
MKLAPSNIYNNHPNITAVLLGKSDRLKTKIQYNCFNFPSKSGSEESLGN